MNVSVELRIMDLWGENIFKRSEWGSINYLVGPNGTGKSRLLEGIKGVFSSKIATRYLSSDRLVSWTRQSNFLYGNSNYGMGMINSDWIPNIKSSSRNTGVADDALILLKEDLGVRVKVESTLSQLLGRSVFFEEKAGNIIPQISKGDKWYNFKEQESHGLKEIIFLLTLLHDDSYNCLMIDEPELHLHPQFQTFFLQEIRKIAGDPLVDKTKKCFFFATHSPHFLDFRTIDELRNCLFFQSGKLPTSIPILEENDEYKLKQLLPKLNTHNKQFFFSSRPIFVEGYTDQQIFSLIQEKRGNPIGAGGTSFIDVQGKDGLDLFFRLCRNLSIECQAITDLDALISGKLRESVSNDERCNSFLNEKGISIDPIKGWGEANNKIDECITEFSKIFPTLKTPNTNIVNLNEALRTAKDDKQKRYRFLLAIRKIKTELIEVMKSKEKEISFISGRTEQLVEGFKKSNVYVLLNGELENYLTEYRGNPFDINDKTKNDCFSKERDYLLLNNPTDTEIKERYGEIIDILDSVTQGKQVNYEPALTKTVTRFIFDIQEAFRDNRIVDENSLKTYRNIGFPAYAKLFKIIKFEVTKSSFHCNMTLIGFDEFAPISFNNETNTAIFRLEKASNTA